MLQKFPKEIEDFANAFVTMQAKRHEADYDPFASFEKSSVEADIVMVELAVVRFKSAKTKDRRAFCVYALLKKRP